MMWAREKKKTNENEALPPAIRHAERTRMNKKAVDVPQSDANLTNGPHKTFFFEWLDLPKARQHFPFLVKPTV